MTRTAAPSSTSLCIALLAALAPACSRPDAPDDTATQAPTARDTDAHAPSALPTPSAGAVRAGAAGAALPTGEIVIDRAAHEPRIAGTPEPTLVLPIAYAAALAAWQPDFRPWSVRAYPEWVRTHFPLAQETRQALFTVLGDFDGDGRLDVVIEGRGEDYAAIVVLLTSGGGEDIVVIEHARGALLPPGEDGMGTMLAHVAPGTYRSPFEDEPLVLTTEAFETIWLEKASQVVYWRDGRLREWARTD